MTSQVIDYWLDFLVAFVTVTWVASPVYFVLWIVGGPKVLPLLGGWLLVEILVIGYEATSH